MCSHERVRLSKSFSVGGPTPETDPVPVAVAVSRLMAEGKKSRFTGYTPILQLAVVEYATPKAMREAGLPGVVMPALAWIGRRVGYKACQCPIETNLGQRRPVVGRSWAVRHRSHDPQRFVLWVV